MNFTSCIKMPISKNENLPEIDTIVHSSTFDRFPLITYDELISIADDVFGTGKWSHAVTSQTVDFVEYILGKYHIGCAAFVRVELPDRTFHEAMGYNNSESSVKGFAIHSARASSITNALKKALLCFGDIIEEKMLEYVSNRNKRKLLNLDSNEHQIEKTNTNEIIKQSRTNSTVKRPISPNKMESEQLESFKSLCNKTAINECATKKEVNESKASTKSTVASVNPTNSAQHQQHTHVTTKNSDSVTTTTRSMTEEELRNERKRKQKEKQEEFRRQMKDKEIKVEESKINCKY